MNTAGLVRRNGALVNTDTAGYLAAKQRRLASQLQAKDKMAARSLEQRVLSLERKVQDIQDILDRLEKLA